MLVRPPGHGTLLGLLGVAGAQEPQKPAAGPVFRPPVLRPPPMAHRKDIRLAAERRSTSHRPNC